MNKTIKDYMRDIQKEFITLNEKKATLIELRKAYANGFQVTTDGKKENYKQLLKNVDHERALIKRETDYLRYVKKNFEMAFLFDRESLMPILAYLVSVMENQEYNVKEKIITFFDDKTNPVVGPINYKFYYLTAQDDIIKSQEELNDKYPFALSAKRFQTADLFKGKNYTGIALFKNTDTSKLIFSFEPENIISSKQQASFGYLDNEKFSYLRDFIEFLINYRIFKECEFAYPLEEKLTLEELYILANDFIENYSKKNIKSK